MLTASDKRDTFLEAFFLWNTPFEQALSISIVAACKAATAASLSLASIAAFTFLIAQGIRRQGLKQKENRRLWAVL